MTFTVEEIEAFGNRLHFNTVLSVIVNGIAVYLILKHSSSVMGTYKYYILSTIISAFLMDFHITFIFGLFPLYPKLGGCPAGISKYLGHFWGAFIQYSIFHFTLSFSSLSVLFGLIYQYLSHSKKNHFLQKPRGRLFVGIFMQIFPIPSVILYALCYSYPQFLEKLKNDDPKLFQFVIDASCDGHVTSDAARIYMRVCTAQILAINALALIVIIKIMCKLSKQKFRMSSATLKLRKQYFKVLIIQFLLPIMFLVIPLIFGLLLILLNLHNVSCKFTEIYPIVKCMFLAYTAISVQFMSLHSVANALTIMIIIKSYRQVLHQWFDTVIQACFKKESANSNTNIMFI